MEIIKVIGTEKDYFGVVKKQLIMKHKQLKKEGWVQTDGSTNQYYKEVIEGEIYIFREDRVINPETNEKITVINEMVYDDYDWHEIVSACEGFGYSAKQIDKWITEGEEIPLMLECVFEMLPNDLMDENITIK